MEHVERGINRFEFLGNVESEIIEEEGDGDFKRFKFTLLIPEDISGSILYEYREIIIWGNLGKYMEENLQT